MDDVGIQIVINLHHVQHCPLQDDKASFLHELLVLCPHCGGELVQSSGRNIIPGLYAEISIAEGKEKYEGTEVVALRKVSAKSAGHLPEVLPPVGESLFIGEVVGIALHGEPKPFCQNIVSGGRRLLSALHIQLIGLIADSLPDVGVGLQPHLRIGHFIHRIQLIPPDGDMGIEVIPFENVHQLHFDSIAGSVSDCAL